MTDDFDLEGIGLTDLDLDFADFELPPLPLDRPRYRSKGWWTPTVLEDFHLDLPDFEDGAQRVRYMITQMARDADEVPFRGAMVSLDELLSIMDDEAIGLDGHR